MTNQKNNSIGRFTAPFEKYIFHFLPGIPVFIGISIISWEPFKQYVVEISDIIHTLQLHSLQGEGLLAFTIFTIILFLVVCSIFLLGMIVDAARHLLEEMFLDGKRWEYFRGDSVKIDDLTARWELDEVAYETEYFYLEFFGNLAVSLAFLLFVIVWMSNFSTCLLIFTHAVLGIVFFLRPIFACGKEDQGKGDQQKNEEADKGGNNVWSKVKNLLEKVCPFMATILLLVIFIFLAISYLCPSIHSYLNIHKISIHELHFLFIGLILISGSFEVYIVRFKRWQNLMEKIWDPAARSSDTSPFALDDDG